MGSAIAAMSSESRASTAETAIGAARREGLTAAGFLELSAEAVVLANSAGLRATHRETFGSFSMTARTKDATGSGWALRASEKARGLDAGAVARAAADKAVRSAKARRLDPGKYTVVLEPAAVADLLGFVRRPLDARAVDEGRSALTKPGGGSPLGEPSRAQSSRCGRTPPTSTSRSRRSTRTGCRRSVSWIDRGALSALHYGRYWAAKQGSSRRRSATFTSRAARRRRSTSSLPV